MQGRDARMATLIEDLAWNETSIGPRAQWPVALRLMADVALNSQFPMLIWWGEEFVQIYNDAYIPLLGARHPAALGQTAEECWPECWDQIGPIIDRTYKTGEPFSGEDMFFELQRNGYRESAYFTFSYSRIDGAGAAGGVLCTNIETTKSVVRELEFRGMADHLANIIYTHAPDGSISWANRRWFEYTRLPDELAMDPAGWAQVFPADELRAVRDAIAGAFKRGEAYDVELRIKPCGSNADAYRWFLLRAVPVRNHEGEIVSWAGSATDVHDRRIAQEALRERLEREIVRERQASLAFQKAALQQSLPTVPGLQFDAIYEPSGRNALVGGDWYDVFTLPDGRVVLSVGDVIGSGLTAAVTMVAVRQAIRGAVQVYPDPAAVLDAADRTLRSEQPDRIVTAFLGILDPLTFTLHYASAGHPSPLVRRADGSVFDLPTSDLPLGLRNEVRASASETVMLPLDSVFVLYTDGLTESTHDVLEGERRLREVLASDECVHSPSPAAAIRRAVVTHSNDDIAILVVRIANQSSRLKRWSIDANDAEAATRARHEFVETLGGFGACATGCADAELVLGELLGNVTRHTSGETDIALDLTSREPVLHVFDRGPGFTFYASLPRDRMSESGRGLYIVTKLTRAVTVVPRNDGGSHARAVLDLRGLDATSDVGAALSV